MPNFIERFAELRMSSHLTLSAIAIHIGVSLRSIKYYASGEREPSLSTLIALADLFDVSLDYLCGRSDEPERK